MISKVIITGDVTTLYIHIPKDVVKEKGIESGDFIKWKIEQVIKGD